MNEHYARFRPLFAKAIEDEFWTIEDIDRVLTQPTTQYWPGRNAALITEIVEYSGGKAIQTLWAAGDMQEMLDEFTPVIENWARSQGCIGSIIQGRKGWQRALRKQGYEPFSTTVIKRFGNDRSIEQ